MKISAEIKNTFPRKLVVIFMLFSAVIIFTGISYYKSQKKRIFKEEETSLTAIAFLKIGQIENWLKERVSDASVIQQDKATIRSIRKFYSGDDIALRSELIGWMKSVTTESDYRNTLITDTTSRVRLSVIPSDTILSDSIKKEIKAALKDHNIVFTDLHNSPEVPFIHIDILIPLFDSVKSNLVAVGAAVLRIDPSKVLFPLVQSWPTPSKSSETLLLRKERDSILYLNELRHSKNTALRLSLPIVNSKLLASKAVNGFEGVTEGVDYRNIPVVGSIQKIPNTHWYMVAKVDKEEILSPLKRYFWLIAIVVILLILINASIFIFWLWQQKINAYRKQLESEKSLMRLEETIREQYYTLKGITESSREPIFSLDTNYCYTSFNKAHAQTMKFLYGKDIEVGKSMLDYQDRQTDRDQAKINLDRTLAGQFIVESAWSGSDVDSRRFFEVTHNPIINDKNEVVGLAVSARDMTERKRIEEKLKASEELYRSLFENMLNGFAYCKMIHEDGCPLDFLYISVNESFTTHTGLKDVMGKRASEAIPGIQESDPELLEKYDRVSSTGKPEVFEIYVESLKMWFAISVYCPQKGYFVAVFDVVTARKLAEEKLKQNEITLQSIIDNSNSLIYLVDSEGRFVMTNKHLQSLLSIPGEKLVGQTREVFLPKDIAYLHRRNDREVFSSGKTQMFEEENIELDGKHYYLTTKFPLFNSQNKIYAVGGLSTDITERKNIEKTLTESEERFRSLYENVTIGIYRTTVEGRILMANPALVSMLGFDSFEQLKTRNLEHEGYEPDYSRSKFLKTIDKEGKIIGLESAWKRQDGSTLYVRESAKAIKDADGRMLYYDGTVEDITDRKKAEEALLESEDKFKYVFDHSVAAKSITFPTGEIHVNKAFCEMTGYSSEELSKIKWQDISYQDDISLTENELRSLVSGEKKSTRFIKRYIHKKGHIVWADVGTALRRDGNSKPLYFMTTAIDITERKHAEESLHLKNFVFDDSIAANSISDINGILTEVNASFLRFWGYKSKNEVIGKSIASFIKSEADANKILTALTLHGEWEGDYSAIKKDGSVFIAHGLATLVKDEKGQGIGYQSAVLDVTDAKRAEDLIHQLNEELEQKVIHRTELLEAANKELEAFSYSVSHDLRAPLRSVHGYTKILLEEYESGLDEEGKRICGIISSSATQMGELIDDLLSFSRIGRASMNMSLLDMRSIVYSVFQEISSPDEKARTILKVGRLHKAFGDTNLLKLVWTNLISNAIKYSSKEIISEISIGSQIRYDRIIYSVKDNGVGFDMNYKHKLFGVFQRLHSESEFEGNGVGLAIVQRIVLKHGGKVWAEGEEGKGATFYFSLPVQDKSKK